MIVARGQTAGRGRWGRTWSAPPGKDLLFSILLSPPEDARLLPAIPLAGALAVADTLDRLGARDLRLRWPNDVLVRDRKISGVLAEHRQAPRAVVLGIGLNVTSGPDDWPPEFRNTATSCAALGLGATAEHLLPILLDRISDRLDGLLTHPADLDRDWEARSAFSGQEVEITLSAGVLLRGRVERLSALRGIIVRMQDGTFRTLRPGEVDRIR